MRKKLFHFMFILGIMEGMLNAVPAKGDLGKIWKHVHTQDFLRKMNNEIIQPNEQSLRSEFASIVDFELNLQELQFILNSIKHVLNNPLSLGAIRATVLQRFNGMKNFDDSFNDSNLPVPPSGFVYRKGRGNRMFKMDGTERVWVSPKVAQLDDQYLLSQDQLANQLANMCPTPNSPDSKKQTLLLKITEIIKWLTKSLTDKKGKFL